MVNDHKYRWIFGPMVPGTRPAGAPEDFPVPPVHAAAEYSLHAEWPCVFGENALAHCTLNAHQLAAARQDPRLVILPSIHSRQALPWQVTEPLAPWGVCRGMDMHDMLASLAEHHHGFDPED